MLIAVLPAIVFANRWDVRKTSMTSVRQTEYRPLVNVTRSSVAVDYDYTRNLIFYSDVATEAIVMYAAYFTVQ